MAPKRQKINKSEYHFCEILWEAEPISSKELVRLCNERLGWKKSTTYTVIRRLSDKGVIQSENAVVSSLIQKEEALQEKSLEIVKDSFRGSLPSFVAAFAESKPLSDEDIDELQKILDEYKEKRQGGQTEK